MKATLEYEKACKAIADEFRIKYYLATPYWHVSDDVTDVCFFGDEFYTIDKMYQILKLGFTKEELSGYYEHMARGGKMKPEAWRG